MEKDTILIVEDMEINRELLAEIFRNEYKILEAENGEEGIRVFEENVESLAVVLLDIMMRLQKSLAFQGSLYSDHR